MPDKTPDKTEDKATSKQTDAPPKNASKTKAAAIKCARGSWALTLWCVTIFLAAMILINIAFWGGIWWVNHTASGQNFLKAQIGAQQTGEYNIDFDGLFYVFPAQIRFAELRVTKNEAPVLTANKIFIGTKKISFIKKHIAASFLADSIIIHPTPKASETEQAPPSKPIVPIEIPEISLKNDYFDTAEINVKIANLTLESENQTQTALSIDSTTKINLNAGKIETNSQVLSQSQTLPNIVSSIKYDTLSSILNIDTLNIKHTDYAVSAKGILNFRDGKPLSIDINARVNTIPELGNIKLSVNAENTKALPITIKANTRYETYPVTANANIGIKAETVNVTNISANLPDLSINGKAAYNMASSSLRADISGALKSLKPYRKYIPAAHVIDPSTFSVNIKGQTVNFKLNVPTYRNKAFALGVKDINLSARLKDQILNLESLSLRDEKKGQLNASGTYDLTKQAFDFSALAQDLDIVKSTLVSGTISADIAAKGNMKQAAITGTITPGKTIITLPERFKTSVPELNVIKPGQEKQPPEQVQNIKLNLTLNAKNQIFVQGYGLDAEFGGKLKITGSADKPLFNGNLEIIRGRFEQFGKRFAVSRGKLIFSGPVPPSPFLDIVVETKADDIIAKINITGNAVKPEIGFTSDPPLPADEVMAKVLFGESLENISPFQAAQIAQFAAGGGRGAGPMSTIKATTGLDDIRVDTSGGDTLIGAGAYLSDNVYLDIESGTEPGSASATVEIELTPNIKVESKVGQDAQGGAGIFWEFDY